VNLKELELNYKMIETFVFDWSGVISDDSKPVYEANMMLLDDHRRERISFEEWRRLSALTAAGFLRNCGVDCDETETYETYKKYFNQLVSDGHKPQVIPGARGALIDLRERDKRLLVLSSHPAANLRQEMQRYFVDDLFESVIGGVVDKSVGLRRICQGLGVSGNRVLYSGDTIYDMRAGREAGVFCAAVCSGYHSRERLEAENPDFVLGNISWLPRMI
jgi:phosphoglycolate phosphatase